MRPSPEVLASFGASADPVSLPGGEGTAWRAGEVVLKPASDPRVARWTADLYRDLDSLGPSAARRDPLDPSAPRRDPGFRVPRPLRTVAGDGAAGDWVAQDPLAGAWVAWQWLPGEPASWAGVSPLWPRLIAASRAFHAALAGQRRPGWAGTAASGRPGTKLRGASRIRGASWRRRPRRWPGSCGACWRRSGRCACPPS